LRETPAASPRVIRPHSIPRFARPRKRLANNICVTPKRLISLTFRLGFLKSNGGDIPASNFGLLDQMAALEWIKNNIQAFGGNPNAVTVMGHGTGAACANFLMMAPPVNNNSKCDGRTPSLRLTRPRATSLLVYIVVNIVYE